MIVVAVAVVCSNHNSCNNNHVFYFIEVRMYKCI